MSRFKVGDIVKPVVSWLDQMIYINEQDGVYLNEEYLFIIMRKSIHRRNRRVIFSIAPVNDLEFTYMVYSNEITHITK